MDWFRNFIAGFFSSAIPEDEKKQPSIPEPWWIGPVLGGKFLRTVEEIRKKLKEEEEEKKRIEREQENELMFILALNEGALI